MLNRLTVAIFGATFFFVLGSARLALASEPMVPLAGSHPSRFDFRDRPAVPPNMQLSLVLIFALKNKTEFQRQLREIEDPK